jgi:nitroreductase
VQAPSLHNSQPWHFELRDGALDVYADRGRQVQVLDPRARQLHISCGCAVFNARVALAAAGVAVDVHRMPDPHRPNLVATLIPGDGPGDGALARLDGAIDERRTNRRRFTDEDVEPSVVAELVDHARAEGGALMAIVRAEHRQALMRLSQLADRYELADPGYRAELRRWTTDDPRRDDGVSARSVAAVDGTAQDELPLRDFDSAGSAWLPAATHSSSRQCLLLLTTTADDEPAWVRAGEALERVLLELADRGYATSPLTQVIEVRQTHELLREELGLSGHPQLLLRVGRAGAVAPTRRRPVEDVLTVIS